MEIKQIYYVLEVAKYQSFSKAADALFITQPTISKQIRLLEEELHVNLFRRTTRNVILTPEGETFCQLGQNVVNELDKLMLQFHQSSSEKKLLIRLGVFPLYKSVKLGGAITDYFSNNTNVLISLQVMDNYEAYQRLQKNELDFAILRVEDSIHNPDFHYETLIHENLVALMSTHNEFAKKEVLTGEDLSRSRLLCGGKGSHYYESMMRLCKEYTDELNIPFYSMLDTDLIIDMVKENKGITLMAESSARQLCTAELCFLPLTPPTYMSTCIVYPRGKTFTSSYNSFKKYLLNRYTDFNPLA